MQINFTELVNQAQNGDRGACSKLYQLTFKSSYYLALRTTGNESFAAQLVEASYKKAFSSIASLKNPESFEAWVKHITAVKSIELLKQKNQLVFDGQTVLPSEIIEDGSEFLPKGLEKSANAGKVINKIVDSLPTCQRVVILLHYFNEMPVSHIARMLACTENDVNAELYSARSNIKKCIDRMINRETEIYPSVNKPLLATILQYAGNQQTVDETLLREIFVSATEGMFNVSTKQPHIPENVSLPIPTPVSAESAPQAKTAGVNKIKQQKKKIIPDILKKLNALTKKQKIMAAVCVAVAVVIIIVGAIGIPKLADSSVDKPEETTSDVSGEISNEIDSEMLKQIEVKADNYSLNLKDYYNFYNNEWQAMKFRFEYIDANDIPDLVLFGSYKEKNICIVHADGNYVDMETSDFSNDTYVFKNPENLWVGKKGQIVLCEQSEDGKYLSFTEYRLEKETEEKPTYKAISGIQYENDYFEAKPKVGEKWYYWAFEFSDDEQELSGWKEFETKMHEILTEYHRLTNGYDVSDFVNSGKSLVDYLETAKITEYKFPNMSGTSFVELPQTSDTTEPTAAPENVNWKESSVLNNSFDLIENYNEKSCLVKMADTGYFGLIDLKGNIVVEPEYGHYFDCCSYGGDDIHYIMQDENYNEYFIDMNTFKVSSQVHGGHGANDHVIPAGFDDIDRYHNGLAAAKKNGKWGYVDKSNNTVIPFEYEQVEDRFITDDCRGFDGTYIPVKKNGKMGIINKQNQIVVPFEYSVIMHGEDGIFIAQKNGKWGFIGIGVEPKEPKEPKKPASGEKTPEWEINYLKTINHEAFENFNFILTDLDNNGVPDLILVMHRGTRGPITTITMNGKFTDTYDEETGYFDYLYYSEEGEIATSSFYNYFETDSDTGKSYRNLDECFSYSYFKDGSIRDTDYVHRVTIYDKDTDEEIGERYYVVDENYNEVEISESDFNRIYKDITDNYTKAYETSVENFKSSGKDFSDYMQEF